MIFQQRLKTFFFNLTVLHFTKRNLIKINAIKWTLLPSRMMKKSYPQYKIENWVTFVVWHLRYQCQSPYPRKTNEDNKPSEQTRETKFKSCLSLCSFVTESMLNPILFICFLNGITSTLQTSKNIPELFDKLSLEPRNVFFILNILKN